MTAREILDQGSVRIERELASQPELQSRLMDTMGTVYQSLGLYKTSVELFSRSLEARRKTLGSVDPAVAESLNKLGYVLVQSGDYAGAETALTEALALRESRFSPGSAEVAETLGGLGELAYMKGLRRSSGGGLIRCGLCPPARTKPSPTRSTTWRCAFN